ncbi:protein-methionine sulfoxide oxidase mical2b [Tachysurus fulvidraco]|uniref:protein-methionine sulfoxide oxidase mical2b n=1 Tax=Tachysurus fulvidraco TaxID=1234273 RepID=UPI001FEF03BD|nr:protein-methionine sulfoxide oxidase mical2b [Tachysurus fulvidraco]
MAAVKALQQWCKVQCEGYRDVSITNMTTSFRDGLAFCALIHKHRPDLIDFDSLNKENVFENNHLAFRVAEDQLSIPALLDAEDMVALKVPDRLSILTYVSQYYNFFHGRSPIGGLAGVKRPAEEPIDGSSGRKNPAVTAKAYSSSKPDPDTKRDVVVERPEKAGTINRNCSICNNHVHLVQRHLVDGKLYHRNCFKCSECFNILLSGTYKSGKEPNTFICKSHQNTHKPPPTQVAPPARYSQTTPTTTTTTTTITSKAAASPKNITLKSLEKDSTQNKPQPFWVLSKNGSSSAPAAAPTAARTTAPTAVPTAARTTAPTATPTAVPTAAPTAARTTAPTATPTAARTAARTAAPTAAPAAAPASAPTAAPRYKFTSSRPAEQKLPSETPKEPSSSVLRNLEARQRFFEPISSPVSVSKDGPGAGGAGAAGGAGKVKQQLRAEDWTKDKKKEKDDGDKEKVKSVISKFVTDETSRSSSSPSSYALRSNAMSNMPRVPAAKPPNTRVLLKAPAMDLELSTSSSLAKTSNWLHSREKSPVRAATTQPTNSKETDAAPSDWRSLLKPVAKNTKPRSSSTPTSESKTSNAGSPPWESPTNISSPSSTASPSTHSSSMKSDSTPSEDAEEGLQDYNVDSSTSLSQKLLKPDYIPREEILRELKEIEMKLNDLEKKGVELEKQLRQCEEENQEDVLTNDLMVDWFNLIRSKQVYIRRESELVYVGRSQDLEEEQPNVEAELRKLMEKPEHLKTSKDKKREEELMAKLVEIVNDRNAIVDGLDEDRLREEEEDEQLNKMMQNLDIKKEKKKRSSMSRLFGRKSKHEDES